MKRHLKIKNTIGTKVFGLAVFLLVLTIVLVAVLLWQVTVLNTQLEVVEGRYLPLANAAANLEEYGLRRRLAFERWYGALNNLQPNPAILAEARTNYDLFTVKLSAELHRVDSLAGLPALIDRDREELAGVRTSLLQVMALYAIISNSQRQVLEDMEAGRRTRVNSLIDVLNDTQRLVQDERSRIQRFTQQFVSNAAVEANQRQSRIVWVSIAATLVSVLLGLTFSALVTRRLVNPVQSLIGGSSAWNRAI